MKKIFLLLLVFILGICFYVHSYNIIEGHGHGHSGNSGHSGHEHSHSRHEHSHGKGFSGVGSGIGWNAGGAIAFNPLYYGYYGDYVLDDGYLVEQPIYFFRPFSYYYSY
jgi:hypothetical protein